MKRRFFTYSTAMILLTAFLVPNTSFAQYWSVMDSGITEEYLWGVWGSSGNNVYAVGGGMFDNDSCLILHYDGTSWSEVECISENRLENIWGSSENDIFAVGTEGTILHYDGSAWSQIESGTTQTLTDVWCNTENDFFAVGAEGTILHYDGSSWSPMESGTTDLLMSIWGNSGTKVFAVGLNGTILHYNGSSWLPMESGTTEFLLGVWGSSWDDVFVVSQKGTILHYDGTSWSEMESGITNRLASVWGTSATDVYVVGANTTLLHYDGSTWSSMASPVPQNIFYYDVWGSSSTDVFIVGKMGVILESSSTPTSSTSTTSTTTIIETTTTTTSISPYPLLPELYNSGDVEGSALASSHKDFDGDGVNDVFCTSLVMEGMEKFIVPFQAIKGKTFTPFYDWVTPYGDFAYMFGEIIDIDQNGTYELVYVSIDQGTLENQLLARITVYDLVSRDPLWQSLPFYLTSSSGPLPFLTFSGFLYDLTGTDDLEWVFFINETDPLTEETTGKVMVYRKNQNDVGFSQLLWEQTYPGFSVRAIHDYDLDGDGKENLSVRLAPDQGSSNKGAIIHYRPSGDDSFSELVRFEASQPGNILFTAGYAGELFPTQVDHGIAGKNLLFRESWQEMDQKKYVLYAYRADPPYTQIGTYTYETYDVTGSLFFYLDDYDGDGWNEITMHHSDAASKPTNIEVYRVEGGNFTLSKIWETGDTSGRYYVYPHWDSNQDSKADLCLAWIPPDPDTTSYGTLIFYEWTGDGFSQLYQFRAHYPGSRALVTPLMDDDGMVTGPTGKLYVPVNLDCSPGNDLALHHYHLEYSPQPFSEGKVTIYNLPSQKASMESEMYSASLLGSIAHLQSAQSNDILMTTSHYRDGGVSSNVLVLGCNQICPLQKIYGKNAKEVAILRNFRDELLSQTLEGRELIKLYYQWSPVIVKAIEKDGGIKESLQEIIDEIVQLIQ
jgi:hypothetical protein